jgi:hypothetical protein
MLGSFGLWASSKGMRVVSDLVGMTRTDARAKIVADGLVVGTETPQQFTDSADESKHDKIVDQTPDAGVQAPYESPVDVVYGVFSFSVFGVFGFVPAFGVFGFTPTFNVFSFTVFNVFSFTPFSVFGFSFSVFTFTPTFAVFGFSFSVFSFTPTFAVFGFR